MDSITLRPIGTVHSTIEEKVYKNWGSVISTIELNPEYIEGLARLGDYSHAMIIFYMDGFMEKNTNKWKRKPRGISTLEEIGCFAQRTKHRPNPLGITIAEILSIKENIISVRGLDANNGTQVLDIKPYIPDFDRRENALIPIWMKYLMKDYF
ncbi:MAG: tRNA (N6-threonylcarbamoyladenosine(37)-N6)-methyltransferase TrmO [Bacillota bacterium]|nr:tRNA (N6-threonylcarbamoyladenosine(37)-N6)-methyltransferase TrmO [Bacillota bacterium]